MVNDLDGWREVITSSIKSLQKTAEDLKTSVIISQGNIDKAFSKLSDCQQSRSVYREGIEEILKEQKEINKKFNDQINGREGLFVFMEKLSQSVIDLKDTVDTYVKSTFFSLMAAGVLGIVGKYFKWW
jgi:uncharacterized ion transporter superfamily protein YfcC